MARSKAFFLSTGVVIGVVSVIGALTLFARPVIAQSAAVYSWGSSSNGGPDCGSSACPSPQQLSPPLGKVSSLDAANSFNLAITNKTTVKSWGQNDCGQLGDGNTTPTDSVVPVLGLSGVIATATGEGSAIALTSGGAVYTWGHLNYGTAADPTDCSTCSPACYSATPTQVMSLSGVQAVAAGGKHFYALLQSGAVMAWGDNTYGELGDGTTTSSSSPAAVDLPSPAMAISSGNIFGDALLSNGELMTWGDNDFGQLGNPNVDSACNTNPNDTSWCSYVPVPVLNSSGMPLQGVTAISAGGDVKANGHNLALLTGGTVMAWGDNESGQLGNPSVTGICNPSDPVQKSLNPENMCTDVPVAVMGLPDIECMPDIQCIAAGGEHSMALSMDGDLYTWGDNSSGQLGDGTKTNEMLPEMVLTGVSEMAAGSKHSIALSTSS